MRNKNNLLHIITVISFAVFIILGLACATNNNTVANTADLSKYNYATISNVMGYGGSSSLMDMEVKIYNALANTRLQMIGDREIGNISDDVKASLLEVRFSATTSSGNNTVSINFVEYISGRPVASVRGQALSLIVAGDTINTATDRAIAEAVKLFPR